MIELTIEFGSDLIREWGVKVGDPWEDPLLPPIMLFIVDDIADVLRDGEPIVCGTRDGDILAVSRSGYITVRKDGCEYVYELFPARFDRPLPYEPIIYVGRWPD